jgi:hypothetical protein
MRLPKSTRDADHIPGSVQSVVDEFEFADTFRRGWTVVLLFEYGGVAGAEDDEDVKDEELFESNEELEFVPVVGLEMCLWGERRFGRTVEAVMEMMALRRRANEPDLGS